MMDRYGYPDNYGLCGKCGALPREHCRDSRGRKAYSAHGDRFIIGQRRTFRKLSR